MAKAGEPPARPYKVVQVFGDFSQYVSKCHNLLGNTSVVDCCGEQSSTRATRSAQLSSDSGSCALLSADASSAVGTATIPIPVSTIASVSIRPAGVIG